MKFVSSKLFPGLAALSGCLLATAACESNSGGLERATGSGGDSDGSGGTTSTSGGSGGNGGSSNVGGEAGSPGEGGSAGESVSAQGSGGGVSSSSTGGTGGGSGGTGTGGDGSGGTGGEVVVPGDCEFHNDPAEPPAAGGQGGAGSEDIHLESSNFIGNYLVDSAGIALYIYGADFPGDCDHPPVTNCYDDCVLSWPIFDAGPRSLGEGLADGLFGTFTRDDGAQQTTYRGWPLYYYKRDAEPGDLVGHGRGRIWFAAEAQLPNIMVMRASEENGGIRYLSTGRGYTLYSYAADTVETPDSMPSSACTGGCLDDFEPFVINSLRPAQPIEPADVTVFIRDDTGELQAAYRGVPLYTSRLDARSGDLLGAEAAEWSVVEL